MRRLLIKERTNWRDQAHEFGFNFHTMHGQPYWDESAYYAFTLKQIEDHLEAPTEALHKLCLEVIDHVLANESLLQRFGVPLAFWDVIVDSWRALSPTLYGRMDFSYAGAGPAKLLEYNADTPTSLYETGFWQWLWLEQQIEAGLLPAQADQFNSVQDQLIARLRLMAQDSSNNRLTFACCQDSTEDRGTVQYLQDCALEAGWQEAPFIFMEDIGEGRDGAGNPVLTNLDDEAIGVLFKLYPWEFLFEDAAGTQMLHAPVQWIEPAWKALLSNKALLPVLWSCYPGHPNLLPAFFADDSAAAELSHWVRKPLFSREGSNISIHGPQGVVAQSDGPYGEEGFIVQAYQPLPVHAGNHTLVGSWVVGDTAAGLSIREDSGPISQDLSRFLPHIILD